MTAGQLGMTVGIMIAVPELDFGQLGGLIGAG